MTTLRGSYPHPVLDASDDVASYFEVSNFSVTPSVEDIGLNFDVRTDDSTLRQLLDSGEARLSLRWQCSATLASDESEPLIRRTLSDGNEYEFWLDHRRVRGSVTADVRVVVACALTSFRWGNQHPDYGDAVFDLGIGDVLADGGSVTFEADKLYDPLDPPIGSCFRFVEDRRLRHGLQVRFEDEEVIQVRLSSDTHKHLGLLAARPELQITCVVLPALIQAVTFIKDERADPSADEWNDRGWFRAISHIVERLGGFDDPAIDIAQRILNYPVDRTLLLEADPEEDDE